MRSSTLLAAATLAAAAASPAAAQAADRKPDRAGARGIATAVKQVRANVLGYPEGRAPRIDDPATYPFAVVSVRDSTPIHRAGKRLRALGVAKRLTQLWTGEFGGVFEGIDISPLLEPVG